MSDEIFEEVLGLLYGTPISKMNPAQSDVATHDDRKKRAITAGLSAVGASAGAGGLALAGKEMHHGFKTAPAGTKLARLKHVAGSKKLATTLLPLEAVGLGGELMATKILHGDTKKKPVSKDLGELVNNASTTPRTKGQITRAVISNPKARKKGLEYTSKARGKLMPTGATGHAKVEKSDRVEVTWGGEIAKANEEKQQIFG